MNNPTPEKKKPTTFDMPFAIFFMFFCILGMLCFLGCAFWQAVFKLIT